MKEGFRIFQERSVDIEYDYERFIRHYPKVMEPYIEYGIYLCQKNKGKKAKDIYLQGLKQTGMTSDRGKSIEEETRIMTKKYKILLSITVVLFLLLAAIPADTKGMEETAVWILHLREQEQNLFFEAV